MLNSKQRESRKSFERMLELLRSLRLTRIFRNKREREMVTKLVIPSYLELTNMQLAN